MTLCRCSQWDEHVICCQLSSTACHTPIRLIYTDKPHTQTAYDHTQRITTLNSLANNNDLTVVTPRNALADLSEDLNPTERLQSTDA